MHDYKCKRCGQDFQSPKRGKKYCSHTCYSKRFAPVDLTCLTCGKEFTVAYRFRGQKTCSRECAKSQISKTLTTRVTKQCLACGKDYEAAQHYKDKAKYCSYECFLSTRKTRQPDVTLRCEHCDSEFSVPFTRREQRFCGYSCANSGENNGQFGLAKQQGWNTVPRWHAGKTKESDPRLRAMGEKISEIIADKIVSGSWSPPTTGFNGEHYTGVKNGGTETYLRSSYESACARMLDADPTVISWQHEPLRIPYLFEGSVKNYVPDFIVNFDDGHGELWEVKPDSLTDTPINVSKRRAAQDWCTSNDLVYRDVTETQLGT